MWYLLTHRVRASHGQTDTSNWINTSVYALIACKSEKCDHSQFKVDRAFFVLSTSSFDAMAACQRCESSFDNLIDSFAICVYHYYHDCHSHHYDWYDSDSHLTWCGRSFWRRWPSILRHFSITCWTKMNKQTWNDLFVIWHEISILLQITHSKVYVIHKRAWKRALII